MSVPITSCNLNKSKEFEKSFKQISPLNKRQRYKLHEGVKNRTQRTKKEKDTENNFHNKNSKQTEQKETSKEPKGPNST